MSCAGCGAGDYEDHDPECPRLREGYDPENATTTITEEVDDG